MTRDPGKNFQDMAAAMRDAGFSPENCPVRDVLDKLAGKWSTLLMGELSTGPKRFGVLRRSVPDISQRMLTQTLRRLTRDGFITRSVLPTTPPSVEYALTDLGQAFMPLVTQIVIWADQHHDDIKTARRVFDAQEDAQV